MMPVSSVETYLSHIHYLLQYLHPLIDYVRELSLFIQAFDKSLWPLTAQFLRAFDFIEPQFFHLVSC